MDLLEYRWNNRDENGRELDIDGYYRGYEEHELTKYDDLKKVEKVYEKALLEHEPDLED